MVVLGLIHAPHGVTEIGLEWVDDDVFLWSSGGTRASLSTLSLFFLSVSLSHFLTSQFLSFSSYKLLHSMNHSHTFLPSSAKPQLQICRLAELALSIKPPNHPPTPTPGKVYLLALAKKLCTVV